ncbi:MAG: monovalent cation/H+ antiporter subunit D [Phenylobacterium sp.]|uniref:monovalent cation/H+ antiporter subunit D n=1 Tax=Phenylobacterium sp. TaxID=1871053 RepID=UPI00391C310E
MTNPWIIAPILLPAVAAPLILVLFRNHQPQARAVSIVSSVGLLVLAGFLVAAADTGAIQTYRLGDWPPPFGIVLVLDRLAATMLLLTAILGLALAVHASASGLDRQGWHFHALLQFQLLGLNGAFLTGDLFNLFVFFEVLLIASYCLLLHGGGRARMKAGMQYVVVNLVGSTLFLVAAGILYGATGTLNLADMSRKIAAAPPGDHALILAGGMVLTVVFALKAALAPLHLWLPRTYASASPAVAALFVIMTKVGAYSIIRTTTAMFGETAGPLAWEAAPWLLGAALITGVVGFVGVFSASGLRALAAFAVVGSMGVMLSAVSIFQPGPLGSALYYLASSTLAGAALFLLIDILIARRGDFGDALAPGPTFPHRMALSAMFLLAAIGVVGLPPLSGFLGKLLILDRIAPGGIGAWVWVMILFTTFLAMVAFARAGSVLFWKSRGEAKAPTVSAPSPATWIAPVALLACLALLSAAAGPAMTYLDAASLQLFDAAGYASAVLDAPCGDAPC